MYRSRFAIALTALFALLAFPVIAADNGFYIGASVGQAQIEIDELGEDLERADFSSDDMAYKVFTGFRFLTFLAVEGSYRDLGAPVDEVAELGGDVEAAVTGYDVSAVGMLPLGIADIFAKVGMISWNADLKLTGEGLVETASEDGTDNLYGLGFQLRFRSFALRGEVEYLDIEGAQAVYMFSVGGSYTF